MSAMKDSKSSKFHHPYEPYSIQYDLMKVIYECIDEGRIGILESPTGTGKSLSLICSSLTWLRDSQTKSLQGEIAVENDAEEPEWVLKHEAETRKRNVLATRAMLEDRLRQVREVELRQKIQYEKNEPPAKKARSHTKAADDEVLDEATFELADYSSDEDAARDTLGKKDVTESGLSLKSTDLMRKLGLMLETPTEDKVELTDEIKIFFCSRTHSQLSQFVAELRRVHLPSPLSKAEAKEMDQDGDGEVPVKHLPLGSRKNLCINAKVSKLGSAQAISERCLELQDPKTQTEQRCKFLPNQANETLVHQFRDHTLASIKDIEDLGPLGRRIGICPYYASRGAVKPSEIVTLPYPLLLQKSAREALDISLKGHVVVIDEAHNLMDTISNIHSITVTRTQLKRSRTQLGIYLQKFRNRLKGKNRVYIAQVVRLIESISSFLDIKSSESKVTEGAVNLVDLVSGKGLDQINLNKLMTYLQESKLARKVDGYVDQVEKHEQTTAQKGGESASSRLPALSHVQSFISTLTNLETEGRFFYEKMNDNQEICLKYLLLDPTFHFRSIVEEARAVILAGGTMSPMDDYLRHLFAYVETNRIKTFSCGHIIPKENLLVQTIQRGASNVDFHFTYENRNSNVLVHGLGNSLLELTRYVPDGLVVFFPSYAYLEQVVSAWKSGQLWMALEKIKPIFEERRGNSNINDMLTSYAQAIAQKKGGLLLSVIGGKLSEGINFSDDLGRGVVVVGMPFPNVHSAQWKAKLEYIEQSVNRRTGSSSEGKAAAHEFMENACMRAVNQSVGRAIRHKSDYAAIFLFDKRFGNERIVKKLPAWIREGFLRETPGGFPGKMQQVRGFFDKRHGL